MVFTLLTLALACSPYVSASVQTPKLTPCPSNEKVTVNSLSITNAKIGQRMVVNFTFTIKESLPSNPTLQVTMRKESGKKIGCFNYMGSCTYRICGGTTSAERDLGHLWNNRCPVPAMTGQDAIDATLDRRVQFLIGNAPTTISIELKVTDGGTTVGCQSFKANVEAA